MPHGITQCYLPPGRGDIPALTQAEAGTRLSDPDQPTNQPTHQFQSICQSVSLLRETEALTRGSDDHFSTKNWKTKNQLNSFDCFLVRTLLIPGIS